MAIPAPRDRLGGAWGSNYAEPWAVSVLRSRHPAVHPDPPTWLGRRHQCSLNPRSRLWGQHRKGRVLGAEPETRSGKVARRERGEGGVEGLRPHALVQASLDGNFLRYRPGRGRHVPAAESATVRNAAGVKPGGALPPWGPAPLPAQTHRATAVPGASGPALAHTPHLGCWPSPASFAFWDLESAANREWEDHKGSCKPCLWSL